MSPKGSLSFLPNTNGLIDGVSFQLGPIELFLVPASVPERKKEGNVLFNDALNQCSTTGVTKTVGCIIQLNCYGLCAYMIKHYEINCETNLKTGKHFFF